MSIRTEIDLLKARRTKIMATLGPASSDERVIQRLIETGVNVVRMNMSHGDYDSHREVFRLVHGASGRLWLPVMVLADLAGPKIRTGQFEDGGIQLEAGSEVIITTRDVLGKPGLIPSQYDQLNQDVVPGDRILLDDGSFELRVTQVEGTEIACTVLHGGWLKNRKGMNLPGVKVSAPSMTDKDRRDAVFAIELGVDMLALSFVRKAEDVLELRSLADELGWDGHIISKIEKVEALEAINEILEVSDGIMVARGDLGVELPPESVPVAQDQLVDLARQHAKPVIVATQMLNSMITNPRPTRAEVSDVSGAVKAGADAVMLSAETAVGAYPVESVQMLDRIVRHTEGYQWAEGHFSSVSRGDFREPMSVWDAMGLATAQLSRNLLVWAILVISRSGTSARMVSAARPSAPIVAVSHHGSTCRRMNLYWGTIPVQVPHDEIDDPIELGRRLARELDLAQPGDPILVVQGFHEEPERNQPTCTVITL